MPASARREATRTLDAEEGQAYLLFRCAEKSVPRLKGSDMLALALKRSTRSARYATVLALALLLLGSVAAAQAEAAPTPPLEVAATTGMVADVIREVGGPCVRVTQLMGPGIDPHLYRASAGDVDRLGRAQLIVYNGFGLEGQLGTLLGRMAARVPTVALAERIADRLPGDARILEGEDAFEGREDPHLWGAVDLWKLGAGVIADVVRDLRPECADDVALRGAAYVSQLEALHDWVLASSVTVPDAFRVVVTSHDAFAYFGNTYGFDVAGIEGISTESEASIADIRETADLVLEAGVPAIFVETSVSPRTIEAVRAAVLDRGGEVAVGGALFGDAMGDVGTAEGTYIGMVRHNVRTIVESLGGQVAPWPDALLAWAEAWEGR
jgi:manganese/zinc/iron transport system substrate-binding protein